MHLTTTIGPELITRTNRALQVLSVICAVLSVCLTPSLHSSEITLASDIASVDKAPAEPSGSQRTGLEGVLLPACFVSIKAPLLSILEQDTRITGSLTHRDYARTGAARAPPSFA